MGSIPPRAVVNDYQSISDRKKREASSPPVLPTLTTLSNSPAAKSLSLTPVRVPGRALVSALIYANIASRGYQLKARL